MKTSARSSPSPASPNYVQQVTQRLADRLPDCDAHLLGLYTLLALTRGAGTTLEDVHDAWAVWRNTTQHDHRFLVPFSGLAPEVQELDRKYMDAIHVAAGGADWPFGDDADVDDPLTARRIAVTNSSPDWCYLVAFDRDSEARPTDHEADLLVSYLDHYKERWYNDRYKAELLDRPLDVDGGANGVIFHKWGAGDWGFRRQSFTRGPLFWPGWARKRHYSLVELMDKMQTYGDDEPNLHWREWKANHPEVFQEVGGPMGANLTAGTVWVERSSDSRVPGCRRLVQVTEANESFVSGVGFWQERKASGLWTDCVGPGSRRRTRVRTDLFVSNYDRLDGPEGV